MANVTGTPSNDSLVGTSKRDSLIGFAGNDTLQGLGGNDILDGGAGDDHLVGGDGSDTYYFASGYGHDVIDNSGGAANDTDTIELQGLDIADIRLTREGNDLVLTVISSGETLRVTQHFLDADHAIDQIRFANNTRWNSSDILANLYSPPAGPTEGPDTMQGTASNDSLQGLGGDDILIGMAGNDTLEGGSGADRLEGGTGNDTLDGGSGADYMDGGADDDTYVVDDAGDQVIEGAKAGTDTVRASISYTLTDNVEQLILTGADNLSATGNALQNTLIGNDGNNLLDGGAGIDTMIGGKGDDTYVVDRVGETVTEAVNEGNDTVRSAINYTLGINLENLELTGTGNLSGTGNSLNNRLIGNSGNNQLAGGGGDDWLDGGAGNDSMAGGQGNDTYVVGQTGDSVTEAAGEGTDTVRSAIAYTLGNNLENLELTGADNLSGTGNSLNNRIIGNSGNNRVIGNAGNDQLEGGTGNDTYVFASGHGIDVIDNRTAGNTDLDIIEYGAGIVPEQVGLARIGNDLQLSLSANDRVTVLDYFLGGPAQIDEIRFANGAVWTPATVESLLNQPPTATNDSLTSLEDTTVVLSLNDFGTYQDPENNPLMAVRIASLPTKGLLQYHNGTSWIPEQ